MILKYRILIWSYVNYKDRPSFYKKLNLTSYLIYYLLIDSFLADIAYEVVVGFNSVHILYKAFEMWIAISLFSMLQVRERKSSIDNIKTKQAYR